MKKVHKNRTGIGTISFVVLCVFVIVAYGKISLNEKKKEYELMNAQLDKKIASEAERSASIKELEAKVKTKKYIEEEAREKLGLVYQDEIIFKKEE